MSDFTIGTTKWLSISAEAGVRHTANGETLSIVTSKYTHENWPADGDDGSETGSGEDFRYTRFVYAANDGWGTGTTTLRYGTDPEGETVNSYAFTGGTERVPRTAVGNMSSTHEVRYAYVTRQKPIFSAVLEYSTTSGPPDWQWTKGTTDTNPLTFIIPYATTFSSTVKSLGYGPPQPRTSTWTVASTADGEDTGDIPKQSRDIGYPIRTYSTVPTSHFPEGFVYDGTWMFTTGGAGLFQFNGPVPQKNIYGQSPQPPVWLDWNDDSSKDIPVLWIDGDVEWSDGTYEKIETVVSEETFEVSWGEPLNTTTPFGTPIFSTTTVTAFKRFSYRPFTEKFADTSDLPEGEGYTFSNDGLTIIYFLDSWWKTQEGTRDELVVKEDENGVITDMSWGVSSFRYKELGGNLLFSSQSDAGQSASVRRYPFPVNRGPVIEMFVKQPGTGFVEFHTSSVDNPKLYASSEVSFGVKTSTASTRNGNTTTINLPQVFPFFTAGYKHSNRTCFDMQGAKVSMRSGLITDSDKTYRITTTTGVWGDEAEEVITEWMDGTTMRTETIVNNTTTTTSEKSLTNGTRYVGRWASSMSDNSREFSVTAYDTFFGTSASNIGTLRLFDEPEEEFVYKTLHPAGRNEPARVAGVMDFYPVPPETAVIHLFCGGISLTLGGGEEMNLAAGAENVATLSVTDNFRMQADGLVWIGLDSRVEGSPQGRLDGLKTFNDVFTQPGIAAHLNKISPVG